MNILREIKNIFNIFNGKKKLLIFESKKQYLEIFYEIEKTLRKKEIDFQSILINEKKDDAELPKNILRVSSKIIFPLLKYCKGYDVLTSTPTINKSINNACNFYFFQHSLVLNEHETHKKHMLFFDKIYVCSLDQFNHLCSFINKSKIHEYKYYHHGKFFDENNVNHTKIKLIKTILIAPSFGKNSLLHHLNLEDLSNLVQKFKIIFRFHPESLKIKKDFEAISTIKNNLKKSNIHISNNTTNIEDIKNSDFLLTESSGIALTFTYIKNVPPIFVKSNNEQHKEIRQSFSENFFNEIAFMVENKLSDIEEKIKLIDDNKDFREKIINFKKNQFKKFSKDNSINLII